MQLVHVHHVVLDINQIRTKMDAHNVLLELFQVILAYVNNVQMVQSVELERRHVQRVVVDYSPIVYKLLVLLVPLEHSQMVKEYVKSVQRTRTHHQVHVSVSHVVLDINQLLINHHVNYVMLDNSQSMEYVKTVQMELIQTVKVQQVAIHVNVVMK